MSKINDILNSAELVVATASASWCGFCQKIGPVLEEVSKEHAQYKFVKVDVQVETEFAGQHKISGFPTTLFMKNGQEVGRAVGYMTKEDFIAKMKAAFKA